MKNTFFPLKNDFIQKNFWSSTKECVFIIWQHIEVYFLGNFNKNSENNSLIMCVDDVYRFYLHFFFFLKIWNLFCSWFSWKFIKVISMFFSENVVASSNANSDEHSQLNISDVSKYLFFDRFFKTIYLAVKSAYNNFVGRVEIRNMYCTLLYTYLRYLYETFEQLLTYNTICFEVLNIFIVRDIFTRFHYLQSTKIFISNN